jgi:hypothetical protein
MSTDLSDLVIGQRVEWMESHGAWSRYHRRGTVSRLTAATAFVLPDRAAGAERFRAGRNGTVDLRVLTPHDLAVEAWEATKPRTTLVRVYLDDRKWRVRLNERDAPPADATPDEVLARVADECTALRAWLATRPAEPKDRP